MCLCRRLFFGESEKLLDVLNMTVTHEIASHDCNSHLKRGSSRFLEIERAFALSHRDCDDARYTISLRTENLIISRLVWPARLDPHTRAVGHSGLLLMLDRFTRGL